jgi:phosphoribosylamine--glycine ligase
VRILVIGSGGREHTLTWKLAQNPVVEKIYCSPGNGGTASIAENVEIKADEVKALAQFAEEKRVDLTVVGPEAPLVEGIVNEFERRGLKIFGPRSEAALIEGSKVFAKKLMEKYSIPTGEAEIFENYDEAADFVKKRKPPLVVKADGLAAGKGVTVCFSHEEAIKALEDCFLRKKFGRAGEKVIVEEYLEGEEVSFFIFTDGEEALPMLTAQDYKRVFDKDKGPNTGGMGSYSPAPFVHFELEKRIMDEIMLPTVEALRREGREYKGVLYGGLIVTEEGPKVLEFNCRFGDPEAQVILPLMQSDLLEIMMAVVEGNLREYRLNWRDDKCVDVVLASGGYPGRYEVGFEIEGIEEALKIKNVFLFHAGTEKRGDKFYTSGGRVLNVSAVGKSYKEAREKAYLAIEKIRFKNMHYRKDIGEKVCLEEGV